MYEGQFVVILNVFTEHGANNGINYGYSQRKMYDCRSYPFGRVFQLSRSEKHTPKPVNTDVPTDYAFSFFLFKFMSSIMWGTI